MTVCIAALNVYPVKSCKGTALVTARLTPAGFYSDRAWMLVNAQGRFLTQREMPRMALIESSVIESAVQGSGVRFAAPGMSAIEVYSGDQDQERTVVVWLDTLTALDVGDVAAEWLSKFLHMAVRLVRFHPKSRRISSREWTGDVESPNQFSDGYAMLAISEASLADLNARLPSSMAPLPMNRFRPNIVLSGLDAYAEDRIHELHTDDVRLRVVKPCTRCAITTTDQLTGEVCGDEPIKTLKSYRWDAALRGVTFGQNVILMLGAGRTLSVGQELVPIWK
jgi:uncharacterized protein YcbX